MSKSTSIRFTAVDHERIETIRGYLGNAPVSTSVKFAIKTAAEGAASEANLRAALAAHRKALALWNPTDFAGVRAKAEAEESLRQLA